MQSRKVQIGVKTLLILVAIVALGLWSEQMRRRRNYCIERALYHESLITPFDAGTFYYHSESPPLPMTKVEELRRTDLHAAWHLTQSDAYMHCASHPWETIPVEPPEPGLVPETVGTSFEKVMKTTR